MILHTEVKRRFLVSIGVTTDYHTPPGDSIELMESALLQATLQNLANDFL